MYDANVRCKCTIITSAVSVVLDGFWCVQHRAQSHHIDHTNVHLKKKQKQKCKVCVSTCVVVVVVVVVGRCPHT